ncbi:MAG: putative zinc ribbon domain protein [candidate division WS6 bacterium OLB20]|uniref:Putative zinc ribbon domain protein n=1 Tax=candidate division WS6 bacterium OLB20 TaxID=1617426 RepID=A0A136LYZ5_9BACT|nr:MAG: putative zinc ribbon domain protein [candidate division WS6 bacterium OLB20]
MEEKFENQCQSCGMPLRGGAVSGTEADGSKSRMYCEMCYKDGAFIDPDMTLDEMRRMLDETVGREGLKGKFLAFMGKMQLPGLKRWKSSK